VEAKLCRLSMAQLLLGILSVSAQASALYIEKILHWRRSGTYEFHGYGLWCGGLVSLVKLTSSLCISYSSLSCSAIVPSVRFEYFS